MSSVQNQSRVALVTGAARGLGARVASQLAAAGWRLLLCDVCADDPALPYQLARVDDLERTLEACRSVAGCADHVSGVVADVRRQEDVEAAVATAIDRFGALHAVVAAAGVIAGGLPAWQTTEEMWRVLIEVNLIGVWRLARAAVPVLLKQPEPRHGRFIAVSSAAGLRGLPQLAAYAATKHGMIGLVRSMAVELGRSGVTANVVCPGSMDTDMLVASATIYGLPSAAEFALHQPIGRLLDSGEVASLIVWLCSVESSGVTGAVIAVDGGMTAT